LLRLLLDVGKRVECWECFSMLGGEPRRTRAHDMACYPPVVEQKRWPALLARVSGH